MKCCLSGRVTHPRSLTVGFRFAPTYGYGDVAFQALKPDTSNNNGLNNVFFELINTLPHKLPPMLLSYINTCMETSIR